MSNIITNKSRLEADLRLMFLTVVINHFLFDYHDKCNTLSEVEEDDLSSSDDSDFKEDSQDSFRPSDDDDGDNNRGQSSSSDSGCSTKKFVMEKRKTTTTTTTKREERYPNSFKSLLLGQDKPVMYLFPLMGKVAKDVFNAVIVSNRILADFKSLLKENITYLKTGVLPIEKNIMVNPTTTTTTTEVTEVSHIMKKQKK